MKALRFNTTAPLDGICNMNIQLKTLAKALPLVLATWVVGAQAGLVVLEPATDTAPAGAVNPTAAPAVARSSFEGMLETTSIKRDSFSSYGGLNVEVSSLDMSNTIGAALSVANSPIGTGRVMNADNDAAANGRFDTTGDAKKQWWLSSFSFTLDFSASGGVSALAFYGTDFGDFDGTFSLRLLKAGETVNANGEGGTLRQFTFGTTTGAQDDNGANNGWLTHFGFYDDQNIYERIVFEIGQNANEVSPDYLGFDDFVVGTLRTTGGTIPEPGSLALVGLSLLGLAAARRRKA